MAKEKYNLAIIGTKDQILGFKALGATAVNASNARAHVEGTRFKSPFLNAQTMIAPRHADINNKMAGTGKNTRIGKSSSSMTGGNIKSTINPLAT